MNAKKVRSLISNDLWMNCNINSLKKDEMEKVIELTNKLGDVEDRSDFRELCIQEIEDSNKNPIIPRLLATLCGKHPIDDTYAFSVFDDYYHESKWDEVIYLGNLILKFNESSYVLKALADCYEIKGDTANIIAIYNRLIKVDHNETDVFYKLAEYYKKNNDTESALNAYKRAVQRHINKQDFVSLQKVWPVVLSFDADNVDYLIQVSMRIAKTMGKNKAEYFLNMILDNRELEINDKIKVLKSILELNKDNKDATDRIVELYREKYKDNPRLEYCLSNTGLLHSYFDAAVAVRKFEKEIEFVDGAFVYHNTWKLGRIRSIEKDNINIRFLSKKDIHTMSCNMAFDSLKVLPKQHILVLKAGSPAETIREHIMDKNKIEWGLRMLLNSFGGQASFKQMKAELVPSVLSDKDWTAWMADAKKELSTNPYFSTSDESNDIFVLRQTPITYEEKQLKIFTREKGFFRKYDILKDFIKNNGDTESEEFSKILSYFENEVSNNTCSGVCSFLILDEFKNNQGMSSIRLNESFKDIVGSLTIDEIKTIYKDIQDSKLKKQFVNCVINNVEDSITILNALLHTDPSADIIDAIKSVKPRFMNKVISETLEDYQSDPDLLLYLFKYTDWSKTDFSEETLLITKLQLLVYVNGKLAHDVDVQSNRQRSKALIDDLFTDQRINSFLKSCDVSSAKRIFSFVNNIPGLDEDKSIGIKHFILSNRPEDAQSIVGNSGEKTTIERIIPKGFLCTKKMFVSKSEELEHIMNVEIPENSKEIGTARDLGDLRENAEYQYAKDKQKNLNFMMNKLTDEIDIAKIILPEKVDLNYVEFGTKVTFMDNTSKKEVIYTVLGPWESNPEKNILNFQAPLGQKIYNMKNGENKKFEINGVKYDYTVLKIELADFELN